MKLIPKIACTLVIAGLMPSSVLGEQPDSTLARLQQYASLIETISAKFNVNPLSLSAIIYTERRLNYDWRDKVFDRLLFQQLHKNSSVGFCQVKVKTAYFIEYSLNTPDVPYYPGPLYEDLLIISESKEELLTKLVSDSLNMCYAAAYLRLIQSRWANAGFPIDDRPDILGTLYSTGLYHRDGSERQPNSSPRANVFGESVLQAVELLRRSQGETSQAQGQFAK